MVIDELKAELNLAIAKYKARFPSQRHISSQRLTDLSIVSSMLESCDPLSICKNIKEYLDDISHFLVFLPFFDLHFFVIPLRDVLQKDGYQEANLLRRLLKEKEYLIISLQKNVIYTANEKNAIENRIDQLLTEIKLLKRENTYLYSLIADFDKKLSVMEKKHCTNVNSTQINEQTLKSNDSHSASVAGSILSRFDESPSDVDKSYRAIGLGSS